VSTLETGHGSGALGEQIHDLALALVAPLGPDDDDEFAHEEFALARQVGNT
jgi:hypothetical protein